MDKYSSDLLIKDTSFLSTFIGKTKDGKNTLSFRGKRWIVVISIHLTFFLSFYLDIQILEGTLSGSRFMGLHLADVFTSMQIFLATNHLSVNGIIATLTIVFVYLIVGGRAYCSWVCPYGLISEIGEKIHDTLVHKHIIKNRTFNHNVKYFIWAIFLMLSFVSGFLVFEVFNVVGILSRFIVYGWSIALIWVLVIFLVEVFYSRRVWCKSICPIGTTYGLIGWASATKIKWDADKCDHCMSCHNACFENHVLEITKPRYDKQRDEQDIHNHYVISGDCTLCGRCIDVCGSEALSFDFKLKSLV